MDRQAWIAITLCVIGLAGWWGYNATHLPPAPAQIPAAVSPTPAVAENSPGAPASVPAVSPAPDAASTPSPVATVAPFAEKSETLRNEDLELRLTNRGGGISEAVLLKH